jgi:octaprenyl-diphosphate synthase
LVGDYLLSKGLLLCIDHKDFDLLEIISVAVREMSEGELLQIEKTRRLDIDESTYMEIIRQKTATLIASCCALGAASVHASEETVEQLRQFGENIGIAFQIKDDLFDYGETKIGKPTGIDIREKKMTLPLIHVINKSGKKQKKWLIQSVKHHNKDKKRVKRVITFVKEQGGLEHATMQMHAYKDKALAQLHNFPKNEFRDALEEMVRYVIERKK